MNTQEDLKKQIMSAQWVELKSHNDQGRLFLVDAQLDLVNVGEALRDDVTEQVQFWIEQDKLSKPTLDQIEKWDNLPIKIFRFLIIQPFVLIQDQAH